MQSKMYLLKEPLFCEQLARFLRPKLFTCDYIRKASWGKSDKLGDVVESKIQLWTPPATVDAQFTLTNRYAKIYRQEQCETGWELYDADDVIKKQFNLTETVYTFNVIAREHLNVTKERLWKSLNYYGETGQANCLLVRSIKVGDMTTDEIKKMFEKSGYDFAFWDVSLK